MSSVRLDSKSGHEARCPAIRLLCDARAIVVVTVLVFAVAGCKRSDANSLAPDGAADAAAVRLVEAEKNAETAFKLWDGAGRPKDQPTARKMFDQACNAGSQLGCAGLGISYRDGVDGTGKDYKKALSLLGPACDAKIGRACHMLGSMYYRGHGVAKDINKAVAFGQTSCELGEQRGCVPFGAALAYGLGGMPKDPKRGFDLEKRACEQDRPEGCGALAGMYLDGSGTTQSFADAEKYAKRGCDDADGASCFLLGRIYSDGKGVRKDAKKAAELWRKACGLEDMSACNAMGGVLLAGIGVPENKAEALTFFEKGCNEDDGPACYSLATATRQGWGRDANRFIADGLLKKACDLGYPTACKELHR